MLTFHVRQPAFEPDFAARLLDHALGHERHFEPSKVYAEHKGNVVESGSRHSLRLVELGPLEEELRTRLATLLPALLPEIGVRPFDLADIEFEMVAHGDGAHFGTHVDTLRDGSDTLRLVTGVYYFHREPRGFTGGALRFHSLVQRADGPAYREVVPGNNSLVVFPAWLPHEVRPVSCPSRRFADARFAVNAWFLRRA